MKIVILAGGLPSTVVDEQESIPKPMAEIGQKPILWHLMKSFSVHGFRDFVICGGYKVNMIKDYFRDYYIYQSDITVDLQTNTIQIHHNRTENWNVTVVDTGLHTAPGARIVQVREYVGEEDFIVVHGDCLSDIDYTTLVRQHHQGHKIATIAVARPTGRNTTLPISENGLLMQDSMAILPENQAWVNACCHVFTTGIFEYLQTDSNLDHYLFSILANIQQVTTYKHVGFWTPIETKRDRVTLETMWQNHCAPWKSWNV